MPNSSQIFVPLTFVGNHDVTRIASKLTDPRHLGTPWWCCSPCPASRASTTATSRASSASRRTAKAVTTRSGRRSPPVPEELATGRLADLPAAPAPHRAAPAGGLADGRPGRGGHLKNEQFSYRASGPGGESVVVLLNIGDEPFEFKNEDLGTVEVLLSSPDGQSEFGGVLGAHGWAILQPS